MDYDFIVDDRPIKPDADLKDKSFEELQEMLRQRLIEIGITPKTV